MPSERPARRLRDVVANIERIKCYCAGLDAVERCLARISEAAVKLGPTAEAVCPGQP